MKVLFVLSGNKDKSSNLVVNQAESITSYSCDVEIDYYFVKGKGFTGYLKNMQPLKQKIRDYNPDLIHAHYSFCGFLSFLTFSRKPVITSLMGSDIHLKLPWRIVLFSISAFWSAIIIKSKAMQKKFLLAKTYVIPNGVDFNKYAFVEKADARAQLGLEAGKTYFLFLADPCRPEKNFRLAEQAYAMLARPNTELLVVNEIPHDKTRLYYYAADVLVLTSFYEGSPNVIKEAMVCNCPIVSTEVGDVNILFEQVEGTFIAGFDAAHFAEKMKLAEQFAGKNNRTKGRDKIASLKINSEAIAQKIVSIYKEHVL